MFGNQVNLSIGNNDKGISSFYIGLLQGEKDRSTFNVITNDFLLNIAAGNDGKLLTYSAHIDKSKQLDYTFPAWLRTQNTTNVMLVASLQEDYKTLRDDSNWSNQYVDIAAPGTNIPVIVSPSLEIYKEACGTTLATAIVSGTANLMLACNNRMSGSRIKEIMLETADVVNELKDKVIGGKVLNIKRAVEAVCDQKGPEGYFSIETLNDITTVESGAVINDNNNDDL